MAAAAVGGGDRDLKVETAAMMAGYRDLRIDEAAATSGAPKMEAAAMWGGLKMEADAMGGGDRGLKMKEVVASEGADTLRRNEGMASLLAMKSTAEAQPVASEAADDRDLKRKEEAIRPWEEVGGILRLKKEADAAWDFWFLTQFKRMEGWKNGGTQENAQGRRARRKTAQAPGAGAGKKRKKVVKIKMREDYVNHMAANPFTICPDLSEEKLAKSNADFRQIYAAAKFLEAKHREYWNALIAQQKEFGYAEDENEVTDDDGEEVVKN